MENLFVTYGIAKKLKDLGFNENCLSTYTWDGIKPTYDTLTCISENSVTIKERLNSNCDKYTCSAPLYQQVVDWLELKGVSVWVFPVYRGENIAFFKVNMAKFHTEIDTNELFGILNDTFNTKKEALNKSIEEALNLI